MQTDSSLPEPGFIFHTYFTPTHFLHHVHMNAVNPIDSAVVHPPRLFLAHDMSELFKCLCFMGMLSLSTRDHNASAVDPGCFMVYNCFQFHGFITNNK